MTRSPLTPNVADPAVMTRNDVNPSSFGISDTPISDMGHIGRSLLWASRNYSTPTGMKAVRIFNLGKLNSKANIIYRSLILHTK